MRQASAITTSAAHRHRLENISLTKSLESTRARLEVLRESGHKDKALLREWDHVFAALSTNLQSARAEATTAVDESHDLACKTERLERELEEVLQERDSEHQRADTAATKLKQAIREPAKRMGRPAGFAGAAQLLVRWGTMTKPARNQAFWRHCKDIDGAMTTANADDWNMSALARVLQWRGLIPELMSTAPFCKEQMKLATGLAEIAKAEFNADLACYAINEAELSLSQYRKLRLALGKCYRNNGWEKKLWYQCPCTGKKIWMPEPLVPVHVWKHAQAERLKPHGLQMSNDGKISQRSYTNTLRSMIQRDQVHLKSEFTRERPAQPVWGIDHASISGARDFTHGGISLGPMYKQGSNCQSELKMGTCVIGQMNDNTAGCRAMLGPQAAFKTEAGLEMPATIGIGAEIAQLCHDGELDGMPVRPKFSLDFATIRGMRAGRGKCAAVCACSGQACLQSYPGGGEIPDLPTGSTIADYEAAEAIAETQCSWGTTVMKYDSLRSAAHTPPTNWDFITQGPWKCSWCNKDIFNTWCEYAADKVRLADLKLRSADDRTIKKIYDAEMKAHSDSHGDQLLYEPPIIEGIDMDAFIIDPLHALLLNLPKTGWKYSFGDTMDADQRERAAAYLSSVGLHLDIREKGKRDPQQKWFSGGQFDEFVLGTMVKKNRRALALYATSWRSSRSCSTCKPWRKLMLRLKQMHRRRLNQRPPHVSSDRGGLQAALVREQ